MKKRAIVAGTTFGNRPQIVQRHCKNGGKVILKREPSNTHDANAIAVYLEVPRLGGIFGKSHKQIGFIKSTTAKPLAKKMDAGTSILAWVNSFYMFDDKPGCRVTLDLEY